MTGHGQGAPKPTATAQGYGNQTIIYSYYILLSIGHGTEYCRTAPASGMMLPPAVRSPPCHSVETRSPARRKRGSNYFLLFQ